MNLKLLLCASLMVVGFTLTAEEVPPALQKDADATFIKGLPIFLWWGGTGRLDMYDYFKDRIPPRRALRAAMLYTVATQAQPPGKEIRMHVALSEAKTLPNEKEVAVPEKSEIAPLTIADREGTFGVVFHEFPLEAEADATLTVCLKDADGKQISNDVRIPVRLTKYREWTNRQGYRIEAAFTQWRQNTVTLQRRNGEVVQWSKKDLAPKDLRMLYD